MGLLRVSEALAVITAGALGDGTCVPQSVSCPCVLAPSRAVCGPVILGGAGCSEKKTVASGTLRPRENMAEPLEA